MEKRSIRTALIVSVTAVSLILLIVLCYYLLNAPEKTSHIELPDYTIIPTDAPDTQEQLPFAEVTAENAAEVLKMIAPMDACHRVLSLEYYWSDGSAEQTAEVWTRGGETKLELTSENGVRHILLRSDGAWLWYDGEQPVQIPAEAAQIDDLIGIPDYAALNESAVILDAGYSTLAGSNTTPCVYARWQVSEQYTTSCWVSPETGLLVRAVVEENGAMAYRMQQTLSERLLPGHEAYDTPFLLPGEASEN